MSGRLQKGPATVAAASPPIVDLVRLVGHFIAASYAVVSRTTVTLAFTLLAPISLLYNPVAYLLAPVLVLSRVLLGVFIFTPYAIITSVARNVYPIYVFVGSAVICALILGGAARVVSAAIQHALFAPSSAGLETAPEPEPKVPVDAREKSAPKPATPKTRLRKRVSIKEERVR